MITVVRMLTYGCPTNILDEYVQIGESIAIIVCIGIGRTAPQLGMMINRMKQVRDKMVHMDLKINLINHIWDIYGGRQTA
ncbi:hypothetical protein Ddye_013320 [Dipteronia dyeriana]|uniref:Uncharacterized protein n=1 Tax=Dipteronia dyeriana TaxID=168575 RepID=A0AAD9X627_9ROSI|nr:hypothetical protein Ddye_013320 [Dipteronia dyeriana]